MRQYADHPMDLADASLVAMAEAENLHRVFTIDRRDFATYRIKRGHRLRPFELIEPAKTRK
jgi:predicted nucleic acid-binding protein